MGRLEFGAAKRARDRERQAPAALAGRDYTLRDPRQAGPLRNANDLRYRLCAWIREGLDRLIPLQMMGDSREACLRRADS
jgi:hypothetical protein